MNTLCNRSRLCHRHSGGHWSHSGGRLGYRCRNRVVCSILRARLALWGGFGGGRAATAAGVSSAGASAALGAGTSASSFTGSAAGAGSATGSVAGVAGAAVVVAVAGSVVVTEAAAVYDFNQSWTNLWCALNLIVDSKKSLRLEGLH